MPSPLPLLRSSDGDEYDVQEGGAEDVSGYSQPMEVARTAADDTPAPAPVTAAAPHADSAGAPHAGEERCGPHVAISPFMLRLSNTHTGADAAAVASSPSLPPRSSHHLPVNVNAAPPLMPAQSSHQLIIADPMSDSDLGISGTRIPHCHVPCHDTVL